MFPVGAASAAIPVTVAGSQILRRLPLRRRDQPRQPRPVLQPHLKRRRPPRPRRLLQRRLAPSLQLRLQPERQRAMRFNRIVLICALILGLSAGVLAQTRPGALPADALDVNMLRPTGERVRAARLLAPNVGWATTGWNLFWTTDGGDNWQDITPPATLTDCDICDKGIVSVFFLDTHRGWALINYYSGDRSGDLYSIILAHTADAGKTWSGRPLAYPGFDPKKVLFPEPHRNLFCGFRSWLDLDAFERSR